ncbi:MAG: uroporphyrinogen decarboxylase [Chitinophagaceae bacterium]|nr:uroporphyrinogen decarboxylase [Chitinophagaceae bacterium]
MESLKNNLLLQALAGEEVPRPPVWMMRQAGRYLPDYRKIREKYSFFECTQKPEIATEITIQPVEQVGVDAAIIFSDILVVPQAMGVEVQMVENTGPVIPSPVRSEDDLKKLCIPDVEERLHYVFDAIALTKKTLDGRVPLIGFAGSPWTLFCYLVQGKSSNSYDKARTMLYSNPALSHQILEMLTKVTILYLKNQVKSGADCVQLFDSWGGLLGPEMFNSFSLKYNQEIIQALKDDCPVILFSKGAWYGLGAMSQSGAHALGLDWHIRPEVARTWAGDKMTLQGNLDPALLFSSGTDIKKEVRKMISAFGSQRYIVNLGHGILPNTPVDHARAFVNAVKEME